MDELRVLCAQIPGNELVAAECLHLTGGIPGEWGVAPCQELTWVPRSAYLSLGIRCLAEADTLTALAEQISNLWRRPGTPVPASFRVEFMRLGQAPQPRKTEAILAAANAIPSRPDLQHPQQRFLLVTQPGKLWFGAILTEGQHDYRLHDGKPYRTSSSLPSRLARAAVNLVIPPAHSILDPFCGIGSILLEAAALGLAAYGLDLNKKMVGMTRRNLAHFNYRGEIELGDAAACSRQADAIVTDLPYGRLLERDESRLSSILQHLISLAPQAVYIAEDNLTAILEQAGYQELRLMVVQKRHGMSRYIHWAKR